MFPFGDLLKKSGLQKDSWWYGNSFANIILPIGLNDFNKIQYLVLGDNAANHALISGCVGSGKSQLMHVIITTAVLSYKPSEIQLYIVNFKEGCEYQHYNEKPTPHIRRVAAGVEREEGYEILQLVDEELSLRRDTYSQNGISNFYEYSQTDLPQLPRILFLIDEFQYLFERDDYLSRNSSALLDRLVREGNNLGIHLLLSSGILSQADNLLRKTLQQIKLRIAFSSDHLEARTILAEDNPAAIYLTRPGEAIYNANSGTVNGNNHFQAAYISMEELSYYLEEVRALSR